MLFGEILSHRDILDQLISLKIDLYIDIVLGVEERILKKGLEFKLREQMSDETAATYFLNTLNYKILLRGNQVVVKKPNFFSLKLIMLELIQSKPPT